MELGDRVVLGETGAFGAASNVGSGVLRVGTDAKIGGLWSAGPVDLRDRAHIYGDVKAPQVWKGNGVTIDGSTASSPGDVAPIDIDAFELPQSGGDINLEPDTKRVLAPGSYGTLSVKSRARLVLGAGDYSFASVHIEPQGKIVLKAGCPKTRIESRQALFFRGYINPKTSDGAEAAPSFVHRGTQAAHIEAPFRGEVLAPNAEVILSSHQHAGRVFAKQVRIQAGGSLVTLDGLAELCLVESPKVPTLVPAELTPAPELDGVDSLDPFLDWYYRINPSQIPTVRLRMAAVKSDAELLDAILQRFDEARADRQQGKALMLLSLIGSFSLPDAETYLLTLLAEPLPGELEYPTPPSSDDEPSVQLSTSKAWVEFGYRRKAMTIFKAKKSVNGIAAVRSIALGHEASAMRNAAVGILVAGATQQEKESLRNDLAEEDRHLVDLPAHRQEDFHAALADYLQKYQN